MYEGVQLDKNGLQHLYIQLYQQIKEMIHRGEMKTHDKLPPIRQMARMLDVNNVTVVNAYKLLEEEGLVIKKVGSGTYVAPNLEKLEVEEGFLDEEIQMMNQGQLSLKKSLISFATATPDPDLFPILDVKKAINYVLDRDGGEVFGYQDSLGYPPLREAYADYLQRKGFDCQMKNIQIVSGAQQGIDILAKALLQHGDVVFTEEPTYPGAISAFKSRGARIVTIPLQEDGIDLEALEKGLKEYKPKFFYCMSTFQNPTGYSYSLEKKKKLLTISKNWGLTLVEDDSMSEIYFTDEPTLPLRFLPGADQVIYIKSFSKVFLPGFRIAFMALPDSIIGEMMAAKHTSDISSSGLIQRTFDLLLRRGLWEKHIEGMRQIYQRKYQIFTQLLKKALPNQVEVYVPGGGLNFWLTLPKGYNTDRLYKKCLAGGVAFVPGSVFYPDGRINHQIRLSIAAVEEEEMKRGMALFIQVLENFLEENDFDYSVTITPLV